MYVYVLVCIDACPQLAHGIVNLVNAENYTPFSRFDLIRKILIISIGY